MSKKNTTKFTLDPKHLPKAKKADLKYLDSLSDKDIDYSDIPELDENFWKNVQLLKPAEKQMISLRIDKTTLDWFRRHQGRGYQAYMNAVLRAFVEVQYHG